MVFESEESVTKAKEGKQGAELNGEKLFLDFTNEKSEFYQETHGTREYGRLIRCLQDCAIKIGTKVYHDEVACLAHKTQACTSNIKVTL